MLLAAGTGTRLKPLTDYTPKPLAPIVNVPLLERTLRWLKEEGITEVVVNVHHHADQIQEAIGDGELLGIRVYYSVEKSLLGTSGAVRQCAARFRDRPFYVIYGDNLVDANLWRLNHFHKQNQADATIGLFTPDDPSAVGMVDLADDGRVTQFIEKPSRGKVPPTATMANAGVYILNPSLLDTLPEGVSDFGHDMFPQWLKEGRRVFAVTLGGYLQDTGTPDRYRKANWDVVAGALSHHRPVGDWRPGGRGIIADGAIVDPGALLTYDTIVGPNCAVENNVELNHCILWPGSIVRSGSVLDNVIVGTDTVVPTGTYARDTILV